MWNTTGQSPHLKYETRVAEHLRRTENITRKNAVL